jgi:hypothetical protein
VVVIGGMPARALDHARAANRPLRLRELTARGATWRGCMNLVELGLAATRTSERGQPRFEATRGRAS